MLEGTLEQYQEHNAQLALRELEIQRQLVIWQGKLSIKARRTPQQRRAIMMTKSSQEKQDLFIKFGFTEAESKKMIKGGLSGQSCWKVGNVEWWQSISEEHALKLHMWNFGCLEETEFVSKG